MVQRTAHEAGISLFNRHRLQPNMFPMNALLAQSTYPTDGGMAASHSSVSPVVVPQSPAHSREPSMTRIVNVTVMAITSWIYKLSWENKIPET